MPEPEPLTPEEKWIAKCRSSNGTDCRQWERGALFYGHHCGKSASEHVVTLLCDKLEEARAQVATLTAQLEQRQGQISVLEAKLEQHHDRGSDLCAECGKRCSDWSGNPNDWPICLPRGDGSGKGDTFCRGCVVLSRVQLRQLRSWLRF